MTMTYIAKTPSRSAITTSLKPCRNGHLSKRQDKTYKCLECHRLRESQRFIDNRDEHLARQREQRAIAGEDPEWRANKYANDKKSDQCTVSAVQQCVATVRLRQRWRMLLGFTLGRSFDLSHSSNRPMHCLVVRTTNIRTS